MAMHMPAPKTTKWWIWGGGGLALLLVTALLIYGFDVFGFGVNDAIAPSITNPE